MIDPLPPEPPRAPAPASAPALPWERALIEKLLTAQMREQRAQRRWRMAYRLLWLLLLGAFIWWMATREMGPSTPTGPHTAMVEIKDVIDADSAASADKILPALREAMESDSAKALVLLIDSPGGSPVQSGLIYDEIRRLRKLHD